MSVSGRTNLRMMTYENLNNLDPEVAKRIKQKEIDNRIEEYFRSLTNTMANQFRGKSPNTNTINKKDKFDIHGNYF